MPRLIDVFNGDADGLCALLQWRCEHPATAELVTGVKRDNALLHRVDAGAGDSLLVLDINVVANRAAAVRLLAAGATLRWFDHHDAGEPLAHPALVLHIDQSPLVCTSLLVSQALAGRQWAWAVTGAYGDNLPDVAAALAAAHGMGGADRQRLRQLGELLNYNSYGNTVADLHFAPETLFRRLLAYGEPLAFVAGAPEFAALAAGHAADMARAADWAPAIKRATAAVYLLPDQAWARRAVGAWANQLSQDAPQAAHLLLCPDGAGSFTASVRSAREQPRDVAAFCRQFPGGGGRAAAGGVTRLEAAGVDALTARFLEAFST